MRHALVMSLVLIAAFGCRGGGGSMDPSVLEILAAVSTAFAALAAWFSAWNSGTSARAAGEAVKEARAARRDGLAPRLTLEKTFLDFKFIWPPGDEPIGKPALLSRRDGKSGDLEPPTFILQNFGQSPALDQFEPFTALE